MKLVFDASALLNMIRQLGSKSLEYLRGGFILTLTPYEVGNALWKEATLIGRISVDEALTLLGLVKGIYRIMNMVSPHDTCLVLRVAHDLKITYYDSSYIIASHELNTGLVTDDEKFRKRVRERIEILTRILGREIKLYSTEEIASRKEKL